MTHPKHASTDHEILEVIRRRWSPRAFDPSREVSSDDLRGLFEAARWAPSSFNEQPWRFVVADRQRTPGAFTGLAEALNPFNQTWARHAPVLVLAAVARQLEQSGRPNRSAWYDAGQAVAFLTLQATSIGLGIRQMEGFDSDAARRVCGVPGDYDPVVVMAIGYPGDPDGLAGERERLAERQPRRRRPAEEFVFDGAWGQALRPSRVPRSP